MKAIHRYQSYIINGAKNIKPIIVSAGVCIDEAKRILCVQRPNKGSCALKWEFPGGKVEAGESLEDALIRELYEELSLHARIRSFLTKIHIIDDTIDLTLYVYIVDANKEDLVLHEHCDYVWSEVTGLRKLDLAKADRALLGAIEDYIRQES